MQNVPNVNLNINYVVNDTVIDNKNQSYFTITAVDDKNKIVLGYRFANQDNFKRNRLPEADIISFSDIILNYKKNLS